jgi:membrane protease YdiL (CAAX protease family)
VALLIIVAAEDLVWRGLAFESFRSRFGARLGGALAVLLYALGQLGTGSWLVVALALVCGTVWTVERALLKSLAAPVLTHAVWSAWVIALHPLA